MTEIEKHLGYLFEKKTIYMRKDNYINFIHFITENTYKLYLIEFETLEKQIQEIIEDEIKHIKETMKKHVDLDLQITFQKIKEISKNNTSLDDSLFNINNLIEEDLNDTRSNMTYKIENISRLKMLLTHLYTVKNDLNDIIRTNYKPRIKQSIQMIEIVNDGLFKDFKNILETYNKPNLYKPIALLLQMYVHTSKYYIENIEQTNAIK